MLIFKDALKLAQANKFIFETPTVYNEIVLRGTTEKFQIDGEYKVRINAGLVSNIELSNLNLPEEVKTSLVTVLTKKIDTIDLNTFKEEFNELIFELASLELEEFTDSITLKNEEDNSDDEDEDDEEDYEDDDFEEEEEEENKVIVVQIS